MHKSLSENIVIIIIYMYHIPLIVKFTYANRKVH